MRLFLLLFELTRASLDLSDLCVHPPIPGTCTHSNISKKIIKYPFSSLSVIYTNDCINDVTENLPSDGGGAHFDTVVQVTFNSCSFFNNIFGRNGGAIFLSSTPFSINGCQFYSNLASMSGGGIYVSESGSGCDVTNSIFYNNRADLSGGGICLESSSPVSLIGNNFINNEANNGASISLSSETFKEETTPVYVSGCKFLIDQYKGGTIHSNVEISSYKTVKLNECYFLTSKESLKGGVPQNGSGNKRPSLFYFSTFVVNSRNKQKLTEIEGATPNIPQKCDQIVVSINSDGSNPIVLEGKIYVDGTQDSFVNVPSSPNIVFDFDSTQLLQTCLIEGQSDEGQNSDDQISRQELPNLIKCSSTREIHDSTVQKTITIENACFYRIKSPTMNGGAILISDSKRALLIKVNFTENSGLSGGAVYFELSVFEINNCEFHYNMVAPLTNPSKPLSNTRKTLAAANCGGAIFIKSASTGSYNANFRNCVFKGNSANILYGGAIYFETIGLSNTFTQVQIEKCEFINNVGQNGCSIYAIDITRKTSTAFLIRNSFFSSDLSQYISSIDIKGISSVEIGHLILEETIPGNFNSGAHVLLTDVFLCKVLTCCCVSGAKISFPSTIYSTFPANLLDDEVIHNDNPKSLNSNYNPDSNPSPNPSPNYNYMSDSSYNNRYYDYDRNYNRNRGKFSIKATITGYDLIKFNCDTSDDKACGPIPPDETPSATTTNEFDEPPTPSMTPEPTILEIISEKRRVYISELKVRIVQSKFNNIITSENGGSLYFLLCESVLIQHVNFIEISTLRSGGSIYSDQSNIEIFDSIFSDCNSDKYGGVLFIVCNYDFINFNILNCQFRGNKAKRKGGVIYISNSVILAIEKCLFYCNLAAEEKEGNSIYSTGFNDFTLKIYGTNFVSIQNNPYSEIYMNSYRYLELGRCNFFTSALALAEQSDSKTLQNSHLLRLKLNLQQHHQREGSEHLIIKQATENKTFIKKGIASDTILYISDCCCIDGDRETAIDMHIFNPNNKIHFNCTDSSLCPKFSPSDFITGNGNNSTTDSGTSDGKDNPSDNGGNNNGSSQNNSSSNANPNDSKIITKDPPQNVFMGTLSSIQILVKGNIVQNNTIVKKWDQYDTVLPISRKKVNLTIDSKDNTNFYLMPIENGSTVAINDISGKDHSSDVGFFIKNITLDVVIKTKSPNFLIKGYGNVNFDVNQNDDPDDGSPGDDSSSGSGGNVDSSAKTLKIKKVTVSDCNPPLSLSFSEYFESIIFNSIDFYKNGFLNIFCKRSQNSGQFNNLIPETVSAVLHQGAKGTINAINIVGNITFGVSSTLNITDSLKIGRNAIMIFDADQSAIYNSKAFLTVPAFRYIPSKIIVRIKKAEKLTAKSLSDPNTPLFSSSSSSPLSSFFSLFSFSNPTQKIKNFITYPFVFSEKLISLNYINEKHSKLDVKISESGLTNSSFSQNSTSAVLAPSSHSKNLFLYNDLVLICSEVFDNCSLLSDLLELDSPFTGGGCFLDRTNKTCFGLSTDDGNHGLRFVSLKAEVIVGIVLCSIATVVGLLSIAFVFCDREKVKFSGISLDFIE